MHVAPIVSRCWHCVISVACSSAATSRQIVKSLWSVTDVGILRLR